MSTAISPTPPTLLQGVGIHPPPPEARSLSLEKRSPLGLQTLSGPQRPATLQSTLPPGSHRPATPTDLPPRREAGTPHRTESASPSTGDATAPECPSGSRPGLAAPHDASPQFRLLFFGEQILDTLPCALTGCLCLLAERPKLLALLLVELRPVCPELLHFSAHLLVSRGPLTRQRLESRHLLIGQAERFATIEQHLCRPAFQSRSRTPLHQSGCNPGTLPAAGTLPTLCCRHRRHEDQDQWQPYPCSHFLYLRQSGVSAGV